jgi:hypothetical protein
VEYLHPCIPELKIKDYEAYEAFRCGICSQLREDYGFFTPLIENHDMIVFALLADGLAGREATVCTARCPRHFFLRRKMMCHTQGIRLAAKLNILIAWHCLCENTYPSWAGKLWQKMTACLLRRAFARACGESPAVERIFVQEKAHAQALALAHNGSFEAAWEPSANIFSALFVFCAPDESAAKALRRAGYALGKILFLMRCIETYPRDKAMSLYNVFVQNGLSYEAALENAKYQCGLAASEMANAYNLLNMKVNRTLLDNIIFQGLEESIAEMGTEKGTKSRRWRKL